MRPTPAPLGLYIHIPFCKSKCVYCDFYSLPRSESRMDDYTDALCAHLAETAPFAAGHLVDTVYFGGGTPSYLGTKRLLKILKTILKKYKVDKQAEITLEANPDSAGDWKELRALRRCGFNRLSLGMQSADDEELSEIGRVHTMAQTEAAVEAARKAKFQNLSLDLIYGLPGQTLEGWQKNLSAAVDLAPEHLSCYGLKVEEGTPLFARRETAGLPGDDAQADMYLSAVEILRSCGYRQYEISNFCRKGNVSRHNLKYWSGGAYLGFGPGAHSDFGGRRFSFMRDLDGYIDGVLEGRPIIDSDDLIPKRERSGEYLMLRLRTTTGIEEWEYRRAYFLDFAPLEARLGDLGWATNTFNTYLSRLTDKEFISCEKRGKTNWYAPLVSQEDYLSFESNTVLGKLFGHSLKRFVASLAQGGGLDEQELDELQGYLDELKGKRGEGQ